MVEVTAGPYRDHRAVVAKVHADAMHRPVIRVLENPDGQRITAVDVDLRTDEASIKGLAGHQMAST